jgi:hypothetical protein
MENNAYSIEEVAGSEAMPESTLTDYQKDRLKSLDWYIEELGVVMEENKEYGVLQAQWRHTDRFNKWLYEGTIDSRQ